MEATTHEADSDVAAAEQHSKSGRHGTLSVQNSVLRGAGMPDSMISPTGPKKARVQEFVHGKDHNEETGLPADFSAKHPDGKNKTLDEMSAELKVSREDARHVQVKGRLPKKRLKGE
jgi:hypothetical protein